MITAPMKRSWLALSFLALFAAVCPAESAPLSITSPHFTLVTDAGERQGRQVLDHFEHMRWTFQRLFPSLKVDPPEPMVLIAVRSGKEFQALEPSEYQAKGQLTLAGYFLSSPDKHYILLRTDTEDRHPYATVLHEYTHLQMRAGGDWLPLWLNEGLAEFYQNTEFHDKQVVIGEPSPDDILFLREHSLIPLATLLRVDHCSPYYHDENKGTIFYSESWALTHFLVVTDRQKGTQRLMDYVTRMSRHEDPVAAAEASFGDLKALQKQLESYVHAQQYMQFVLNAAAAPIDPSHFTVKALTQAEFAAQRADLLAHMGRTTEAHAQLEALAAASPSLLPVQESLGYLAWRENDLPAALRYDTRAIELGSTNFFVYFSAANMLRSSGGDAETILADLKRAAELNGAFAPALDELVQSYMQADRLDEAAAANLRSIEQEPGNFYYRLRQGDIQMRREQTDSAEAAYRVARKLAATGSEISMAQGRLEQITSMRSALRVTSSTPAAEEDVRPAVLTVEDKPRHANTAPAGTRHTAVGVLDHAECSYPAVLDLEFRAKTADKALHLFAGDFTKIALTSDSAKTEDALNPCADLNGRTARVVYANSDDKTADGQIVSIELQE